MGIRQRLLPIGILFIGLLMTRCTMSMGDGVPTPVLQPTYTPWPTYTLLPVESALEQPTLTALGGTPSLTPLPSPTPLGGEIATPGASDEPAATLSASGPLRPPIRGAFDVYLGAPTEGGSQNLRFVSTSTGATVTEISIRTDDGYAVRAGQYVYFYAEGSRQPQRVNTAGSIETLAFAAPDPGVLLYEFMPSATGYYLAWLNVAPDGSSFTLSQSYVDGSDARVVFTGTLDGEILPHLIRVTNDGTSIVVDKRPWADGMITLFNPRYDLYMIDVPSGTEAHLLGEPACGEGLLCDGHVSPDGSYLIRTLPQGRAPEPIVVTNLTTSAVVQRFVMQPVPAGAASSVGYPFFTPSGNMVYIQAIGPVDYANYLLVWANLVTGEQYLVAELGNERYRPVGWANATNLLLTREPGLYDTWQINVETGALRQIAGLLFLGHIEEPPLTP